MSEILTAMAGVFLAISGFLMIYEIRIAPIINDDDEKEPEQVYKDGIAIGDKYRPGKGGILPLPTRPEKQPDQGGIL